MSAAMAGMAAPMSQPTLTPLYATGYDLTNDTQASMFLSMMLSDSILQVWANDHARYFWYGVVTIIGIMGIHNLLWRLDLKWRSVIPCASDKVAQRLNQNTD